MSNDFREYSAAFHETNNDLMHYGVLGMKWGVRRAKRYEGDWDNARGMQRSLRKNAKNMVRNTRAMEIAKKKMSKAKKGSKKYDKWSKHYNDASASRNYAQGEISRIKKNADKSKVSIGSHRRKGLFYTPGEHAANIYGGVPGLIGVGTVPTMIYNAHKRNGASREWSKYVVRKRGKNKYEEYKNKLSKKRNKRRSGI